MPLHTHVYTSDKWGYILNCSGTCPVALPTDQAMTLTELSYRMRAYVHTSHTCRTKLLRYLPSLSVCLSVCRARARSLSLFSLSLSSLSVSLPLSLSLSLSLSLLIHYKLSLTNFLRYLPVVSYTPVKNARMISAVGVAK